MFRPTAVILPVACLAAAMCLQASRTAARTKPESAATSQTTTATIFRLEELLDDAESHHRVAAVDGLIADDYRGITIGGGIISKRDVLDAVRGQQEASSQSSDRHVRPLQNAAVYTAFVVDRGIDQKTGGPYTLATRVTDIWQKRGREWKLVNDPATGVDLDRVAQRRP
jgi:hypothetical protein